MKKIMGCAIAVAAACLVSVYVPITEGVPFYPRGIVVFAIVLAIPILVILLQKLAHVINIRRR